MYMCINISCHLSIEHVLLGLGLAGNVWQTSKNFYYKINGIISTFYFLNNFLNYYVPVSIPICKERIPFISQNKHYKN